MHLEFEVDPDLWNSQTMDLQRRESHMERTTGERKVDGLEHRLSNELA